MDIKPPELEFGSAILDPVKKDAPPPKALPARKVKIMLAFGGIIILFIGFALIIRGIIVNLPKSNPDTDSSFTANPLLPITNFEVEQRSGDTPLAFGEQITTGFPAKYTDRLWAVLTSRTEKIVGIWDGNFVFMAVYNLPLNAEDIKLYEDGSISYFINKTENTSSKLYAQKINQKAGIVIELEKDEEFTSHFYYPKEKAFYYSLIRDDTFFIYGVNLFGKTFEIYKSGFFDKSSLLSNYYEQDSFFGIIDGKNCYRVSTATKAAKTVGCDYLPQNEENITYFDNTFSITAPFSQLLRGELYSRNLTDVERKVVFSLNSGETFKPINLWNNSFYFIKEKLLPSGAFYVTKDVGLFKLLPEINSQPTELTALLPEDNIKFIVEYKSGIYAIATNTAGIDQILRYYEYNEQIPASAPISAPVSGPISYVTVNQKYWEKIDPGIPFVVHIEILYPRYLLK